MQPTLLDTDIVSFYLRGEPNVVRCVEQYLKEYGKLNLSILSYYEIVSGLKFKDARKQLDKFLRLATNNRILPLTIETCDLAGEVYAQTRKQGTPIDDIDLLIGSIALQNNLAVATHNVTHYSPINGLAVYDWTVLPGP